MQDQQKKPSTVIVPKILPKTLPNISSIVRMQIFIIPRKKDDIQPSPSLFGTESFISGTRAARPNGQTEQKGSTTSP